MSGRVRYRFFGNHMPAEPHCLTGGTPCAPPRRLTAAEYRCGHPDFPSPMYRWNSSETSISATGTSRLQHDLAGAAASLDVLVGPARVGQGERRVDVRTHPTGPDALEHLPHPAAQPVDLVPHV